MDGFYSCQTRGCANPRMAIGTLCNPCWEKQMASYDENFEAKKSKSVEAMEGFGSAVAEYSVSRRVTDADTEFSRALNGDSPKMWRLQIAYDEPGSFGREITTTQGHDHDARSVSRKELLDRYNRIKDERRPKERAHIHMGQRLDVGLDGAVAHFQCDSFSWVVGDDRTIDAIDVVLDEYSSHADTHIALVSVGARIVVSGPVPIHGAKLRIPLNTPVEHGESILVTLAPTTLGSSTSIYVHCDFSYRRF